MKHLAFIAALAILFTACKEEKKVTPEEVGTQNSGTLTIDGREYDLGYSFIYDFLGDNEDSLYLVNMDLTSSEYSFTNFGVYTYIDFYMYSKEKTRIPSGTYNRLDWENGEQEAPFHFDEAYIYENYDEAAGEEENGFEVLSAVVTVNNTGESTYDITVSGRAIEEVEFGETPDTVDFSANYSGSWITATIE